MALIKCAFTLNKYPETYSEGTRHNALVREAGRQARRFGGDAAKTFEAVWQFNSARCSPSQDEQEVQSIVDWACSQERANKSPCPSVTNWYDHLILNQNGNPKPILANAIIALRYAPEWCGVLAFNEFSVGTVALKAPPWNGTVSIAEWTDHEDRLTANWLQHAGIIVAVEIAGQAIQVVARDRRFHPVREYLDSLKWDGTKRIDAWLSDYLGAERNDYTAAVGARWLISAVARIHKPRSESGLLSHSRRPAKTAEVHCLKNHCSRNGSPMKSPSWAARMRRCRRAASGL